MTDAFAGTSAFAQHLAAARALMLAGIRRSLRKKVMAVVLVTTSIALLTSAAVLLSYESGNYREFVRNDVRTQAEILARISAPALALDDPTAAADNLSLLRIRPDINAAAIYTADGALFASYSRPGVDVTFPEVVADATPRISGDVIALFHRVVADGNELGTVYLQARYPIRDRLAAYLLILATVMGTSLLIAGFVSVSLAGSVTAPVRELTRAARRVIDERDFTARAERSTDDEIGVLVDAFNSMLAEVGRHAEALEASNRRLQQESDERRAAEEALRRADQRKDEFLATLAHELRNPLAPMVNAMTLLKRAAADRATTRRAEEIIERQLAQLVRLVDDLLDVSRITSGKLVIHKETVELSSVIQNAVDTVRPLLDARSHRLSVELPPQPVYLQADPVRLAQVFSNLLNNAAKYSEPGGSIRVTAAVSGSHVEVRVADHGIGMSPATLPVIFQMFAQGDSGKARTQTGLGVGLALAKQLVELHGGSIEAASPGVGLGSVFIVRLPVRAALTSERAPAAAPRAAEPPARYRVLLVDDNVDFASSLAILLEAMGHTVRVVHDARTALAAAAEFRPEFAFLDLGLPDMSGYALARELKALPELADTVLVAISGWGQPHDRQRSEEAGFALHLVKPVELKQIESAFGALVRQR